MADEDFVRSTHPVQSSDQEMFNKSFDREFGIHARIIGAYDAVNDVIKRVACDVLGRLKVVIDSAANTVASSVWEQASITGVAASTSTTILTFTNTGTKVLWLDELVATGSVDAEYEIEIDSVTKMLFRTSEMQRTMDKSFPVAQKIAAGSVIKINATHFDTGTADFDASIIGHRDS